MKFFFFLLIVFGTLALFNPDDADFAVYVNEKAQTAVADRARTGGQGFLSSNTGSSATALSSAFSEGAFQRNNYFVFSTFTADLDGPDGNRGDWRFLGVGNQFIEMRKPASIH